MIEINKVAVIGAGTMGSGIASHLANAGIAVVLLDMVADGVKNRNAIAEGAIQRMPIPMWVWLKPWSVLFLLVVAARKC